ncbi:VanZ family protein [Pseudorhodoferax sp.]|uniref:VanZ family protein n=1 Tax=Pseudorhodoferax sp. TaxID=1993553 RepID=UPI002DD69EB3|nr:VanZ family protein [Pseudorhodoferax sp.]
MRATERILRWGLVLAYFLATSLGHLAFTEWLLQPRESAWLGGYAFKNAVPALLVAAAVLLLAWVWRTALRDPRGFWATGWVWLAWAACVATVDRLLTYSVYEYAHYPQYALLAWLVARALDPERTGRRNARILFWTTLLGMVDECMQYLWVTPTYGNYLDFNDFVVNLLGAAAGLALTRAVPAAAVPARRAAARTEWCVAAGLALVVAGAMLGGRLVLSPAAGLTVPPGGWATGPDGVARLYLQRAAGWYGSVQEGPHRGHYRILGPQEGLLALVLAGLVFSWSPQPRRSQAAPGPLHGA